MHLYIHRTYMHTFIRIYKHKNIHDKFIEQELLHSDVLSSTPQLEKALLSCERQRLLYPEAVILLQRLQQPRKALQVILGEVSEVQVAIDFIQTENKSQNQLKPLGKGRKDRGEGGPLWEDLLAHAVQHPDYMEKLLDCLGIS